MTDETEKARAFLWGLQSQVAEATGLQLSERGERWKEALVDIGMRMPGLSEEVVRRAVQAGETPQAHWPPCGPDEPPWGYWLINSLADQLEKGFSGSFTRPVLGMLATGEINAVTLLAPSGAHVVAFESELLSFANLFGKAVALAMPHEARQDGGIAFSAEIDEVRRHVRDSPEAVRRFRDVVLAYLLEGRPSKASPYLPSEAVRTLGYIFQQGMELFVLGHEYGHVMAGHVADRKTPRRMLGVGHVPVTEVGWRWEQEGVADVIGWKLCLGAMSGEVGLELSHAGVELFFSAYEVLNRAVPLLMTGVNAPLPGSSTHPPADLRRDIVRTLAEAELKERAGPVLEYGKAIQGVVDVLWEQTAPVIVDLHRQGAVPDARWTANL
ncbi:hypothetical protein [Streptomyces sp. NPDC059491]|uniref:hypothetical protein n=1 Tax=Streptomyces sp. NPDC059491 TaxID=3346850 RepID=UPI003694B025